VKRTRRPHTSSQTIASQGQTTSFAPPLPPHLRSGAKHIPAGGQQQPYGSQVFAYGTGNWGAGQFGPSFGATSTAGLPVAAAAPPVRGGEPAVPAETLAYLQQIIADAQRAQAAGLGGDTESGAGSTQQLSEEDTAALQAHLNMLSAQLREIGEIEEDEEDGWGVGRDQPGTRPLLAPVPLLPTGAEGVQIPGADGASYVMKEEEEEEEEDDDDMEEVPVPAVG
jgi:hypothetical protein